MCARCSLLLLLALPAYAQLSPQEIDEINRQAAATQAQARREQIATFVAGLVKATDKDLSPNSAIDYMHNSMLLTAEEGVPIYTRFLTHPHPWVRQSCLRALGDHGVKAMKAGPAIFEVYQHDPMSFNQDEAVRALGKMGYTGSDVLDIFRARLLAPDPDHRSHYRRQLLPALALYGAQAKALLPVVQEILDEAKLPLPDRVLTYRAFGAIHAATPPALTEITTVDWKNGDRGYALLQAARQSNQPEQAERAVLVLVQSLKADTPNVIRNEILDVLGHIGSRSPEAVAVLLQYLDSPVPTLQATANHRFLQLKPISSNVLELLLRTLKQGASGDTQWAISQLLRMWGPKVKAGTDTLLSCLKRADEQDAPRLVAAYLPLIRCCGPTAKHGGRLLGAMLARTYPGGVTKVYAPELRYQLVAALTDIGEVADHLAEIIPLLQPDAKGTYDPIGFMFAARAIATVGPQAKAATPLLLAGLHNKKGWHDPIDIHTGRGGFFVPPASATSALMQAIAALRSIGPSVAETEGALPLLRKLAADSQRPFPHGERWASDYARAARLALAAIAGE